MSYLPTNKKKIRGWKKQVRKIAKWKDSFVNLDIEHLRAVEHTYVKIWIDPWYRLIKRTPPNWYNRIILSSLVDIYLNWREALEKQGEPYYLRIWLYDPQFIHSQVVAAIGDAVHFYDNTFEKVNNSKEFPFEKYQIEKHNLHNFNWDLYLDEEFKYEIMDELSSQDILKLQKRAWKIDKVKCSDIEDTCYRVKKGNVWVGEFVSINSNG